MNLLIDNWIPVELNGELQRISLQTLLCEEQDFKIKTFRDDMELATLQLLVCMVQVVFMPETAKDLKLRWNSRLSETDYQQGIIKYLNWFDVLHPETPFMQTASVTISKELKKGLPENFATIQKLFVGLPEKTSGSDESNAFFDTPEEILSVNLGDAAIALFQQATNWRGSSHFYSAGLKGVTPLTTLIFSENLRKTIWCNVLSREFLNRIAPQILNAPIQEPTWILPPTVPPNSKHADETAHQIGLARGLFWQQAKFKLEVINGEATGFYKEKGMCDVKGFWLHPHTPIDMLRLQANNPKEKPYLSASNDLPLWGQMLSFLYTNQQIQVIDANRQGTSSALVVQQYKDINKWKRKGIKLAVGGYVIERNEKLAGRKHELYSLSSGWETKIPEINLLIKMGLDTHEKLELAIIKFNNLAKETFKERSENKHKNKKEEEPETNKSKFAKSLKVKAKQLYFNNSETIMHSILKNLVFDDLAHYQEQFSALAREVFEQTVSPYEHEDKMLKPVLISRNELNKMLNNLSKKLIGGENNGN